MAPAKTDRELPLIDSKERKKGDKCLQRCPSSSGRNQIPNDRQFADQFDSGIEKSAPKGVRGRAKKTVQEPQILTWPGLSAPLLTRAACINKSFDDKRYHSIDRPGYRKTHNPQNKKIQNSAHYLAKMSIKCIHRLGRGKVGVQSIAVWNYRNNKKHRP